MNAELPERLAAARVAAAVRSAPDVVEGARIILELVDSIGRESARHDLERLRLGLERLGLVPPEPWPATREERPGAPERREGGGA